MKIVKPNFFIIGSAKSGTTSLYHFLKNHPQVFMTKPKETNFFSDAYQGFGSIVRATDYFAQFKKRSGVKVYGEASHSYMTSPRCAPVLKLLFPNAKLIFTLRNPAERAHSLYMHLRRYGHENASTFECALALENGRSKSTEFISRCGESIYNFQYFRSGLYSEQINNYLTYFDKDNLLFINYDDLTNNPRQSLDRLYDFLGIDNISTELPKKNVGDVTARFPVINHFMTMKMGKKIVPSKKSEGLSGLINNFLFMQKSALSPATKLDLMTQYRDDQIKLKEIIGFNHL